MKKPDFDNAELLEIYISLDLSHSAMAPGTDLEALLSAKKKIHECFVSQRVVLK